MKLSAEDELGKKQNFAGDMRTPLTWSSALLALSMARSMSRSPSPLVLYAPRISRRLGGDGCENWRVRGVLKAKTGG